MFDFFCLLQKIEELREQVKNAVYRACVCNYINKVNCDACCVVIVVVAVIVIRHVCDASWLGRMYI